MDDGWKGEQRVTLVVEAPSPLHSNLIHQQEHRLLSVKKKVAQKLLKTARSPYTVKCQSRFLTKSSKVICQSVKVN